MKKEARYEINRYTSRRKNIDHQNSGASQRRESFRAALEFLSTSGAYSAPKTDAHASTPCTDCSEPKCTTATVGAALLSRGERQAAFFFFSHAPVAQQCSRHATLSSQSATGGGKGAGTITAPTGCCLGFFSGAKPEAAVAPPRGGLGT